MRYTIEMEQEYQMLNRQADEIAATIAALEQMPSISPDDHTIDNLLRDQQTMLMLTIADLADLEERRQYPSYDFDAARLLFAEKLMDLLS